MGFTVLFKILMNSIKLILLGFLFIHFAGNKLNAQISKGGFPRSFGNKASVQVPIYQTAANNTDPLPDFTGNNLVTKKGVYGKVFNVNLSVFNSGILHQLPDGGYLWMLRIQSESALSIGIICNAFHLPDGADLFIYNIDNNTITGAYGAENNNSNGLHLTAVPGNYAILELYIPEKELFNVQFSISGIIHDFKGIVNLLSNKAQNCEVNVICDKSEDIQMVKNAVCKYTYVEYGMAYYCSGTLVNNTLYNGQPYMLTANHCISSDIEAQSMVVYFNYETKDCDGLQVFSSNTLSGAKLIATAPDTFSLDFSLVELNVAPPKTYKPYYAGWSLSESYIDSTYCIHHPNGDEKKISKDKNRPVLSSFPGYLNNMHWKILNWEMGTTEGGSSGAPLFNYEEKIIGLLTGGEASCDFNKNDYFQQFSKMWSYYGNEKNQLKRWLNPTESNIVSISGLDIYNQFNLRPVPDFLNAEVQNETEVVLNWQMPERESFTEDFEMYPDFAISGLNDWRQVDADFTKTKEYMDVNFPNMGYSGSYIVINQANINPSNAKGWQAYTGKKFIACLPSQYGSNNDWLISPQFHVFEGDLISFMAKSKSDKPALAQIRYGISVSEPLQSDFEFVSGGSFIEVPTTWTFYQIPLTRYVGNSIYFAIQCISENSDALFIDNFKFVVSGSKGLNNGYLIYRNGEVIDSINSPEITEYTDNSKKNGLYSYFIVAQYSTKPYQSNPGNRQIVQLGTSSLENITGIKLKIYPNPVKDYVHLQFPESDKNVVLNIYSTSMQVVYSQIVGTVHSGKTVSILLANLPNGLYFLKIAGNLHQDIVKLIISK